MKLATIDKLKAALGTDWCGSDSPPMTHRVVYVHDDGVTRVFSTIDDGGFVGIGYPDQWHVIMRTEAARTFAWWVLRMWAVDWFGFRTRCYMAALTKGLNGKARWHWPRTSRRVRRSSHEEWAVEIGRGTRGEA